MPKEMLPIVNKPLLQFGVEEALAAGLHEIGFVTGRGKRAIEDHFDISYELEHQIAGTDKEAFLGSTRRLSRECTFAYTRQIEMRGLGHAVLTGRIIIGDEPFGVVLPDDLCFGNEDGEGVLAQMVRLFRQFRCSIVAIEEVPPEDVRNYGIVAGEPIAPNLFRVTDMVEKPDPAQAPSNLAIIGRYVLTPDIFGILERTPPGKNGELQITDALRQQAREGVVLAYRFSGRRFDCGKVPGFIEATNYVYERGLYEREQG
jgi:UTP--glucose-1-phosphate uridylyltransferase